MQEEFSDRNRSDLRPLLCSTFFRSLFPKTHRNLLPTILSWERGLSLANAIMCFQIVKISIQAGRAVLSPIASDPYIPVPSMTPVTGDIHGMWVGADDP